MRHLRSTGRREGGWTTPFALTLVLVCASIAGFALTTNLGSQKESQTLLFRERAFQAAEAGVDWALTKLRTTKGAIPTPNDETHTIDPTATALIRYRTGTTDGIDQDGDGTVDESDEGDYSSITVTGVSGGVRRTLQVVLVKAVLTPTFKAAAYIDDTAPILDLKGDAFLVNGHDHTVDGKPAPSNPSFFAITSPADPSVLAVQVSVKQTNNVIGLGGMPSVGLENHPELPQLMAAMRQAATVIVPTGTVTQGAFGKPTDDAVEVAYCKGDLHFSSNNVGAGVLVVDGDLTISGAFNWTGIVLVAGRITMTGGGSTKRVIGAVVCGEEVVTITGTVDLLYSSDAIRMAAQALTIPIVCSWREVGNP